MLDENLLQRAKAVALAKKISLSELVVRSLRDMLQREEIKADDPPFSMVTFGDAGRTTHHEPTDFYAAIAEDDAAEI